MIKLSAQRQNDLLQLLRPPARSPGLSAQEQQILGAVDHLLDAGTRPRAVPSGTFGTDQLDQADDLRRQMPGGDDLAFKARLRQQQFAQQDKVARHVRIQPPSANHGTLGNSALCQTGAPAAQVAIWTAESDIETMPVTVTAAPVTGVSTPVAPGIAEFSTATIFRTYGVVMAGTRGFSTNFEFDLGAGVQFTLAASSVALQVGVEADPTGATGTIPLAGMLSFLPIEKNVQLTRTRFVPSSTGPANANATVPVPNFARNLVVWRSIPADAVTVLFEDGRGNTVYEVDMAAGQTGNMLTPIPLSPEVAQITVGLTGGGAYHSLSLIFGLSF